MTTSKAIITVQEWHNALNSNNKKKLSALVKEDVKIDGPRGSVKDVNVMIEWLNSFKVSLTPKRYFISDRIVVVEELGEWHSLETGEIISSQVVATIFILEDLLVSSVSRYNHLKEALDASGLNEKNEVRI